MLHKKHLALAIGTALLMGNVLPAQADGGVTVEQVPLTGTATPTPPAGIQTQGVPKATAIESTPIDNSGGGTPAQGGSAGSGGGSSSNPSWDLYQQVQQLQDQVQQLQGTVEEQGHTIERLRNDQKAQYKDLDQRVNTLNDKFTQLQQAPAPAASSAGVPAAADGSAAMPVSDIEVEKNAYLSAYNIYRTQGPDQAIPPLLTFVGRYPNSTFAPNAYYWLGESYLGASTPDLASAQHNFEIVLKQYPDNAKAPAALYKLGTIADQQGKTDVAKQRMQDVLIRFPKSPEASLATNYLKPPAPAPAAAPAKAKKDVKAKAKPKKHPKPADD